MTEYKELFNTNQDEINTHAAAGWRVHTYGVFQRDDGEVITYALMVLTRREKRDG